MVVDVHMPGLMCVYGADLVDSCFSFGVECCCCDWVEEVHAQDWWFTRCLRPIAILWYVPCCEKGTPRKKKKTDESNADICGEDEVVERQSFVPPFSDARLAAKSMFRASRVLYQNFLSFWLLPTNNPQFLCAPCLVCNSFVTLRRSTVLFWK